MVDSMGGGTTPDSGLSRSLGARVRSGEITAAQASKIFNKKTGAVAPTSRAGKKISQQIRRQNARGAGGAGGGGGGGGRAKTTGNTGKAIPVSRKGKRVTSAAKGKATLYNPLKPSKKK